jgi:hypothetical protein
MTKKIITTAILLGSAVIFSACTLQTGSNNPTITPTPSPVLSVSPTPTVSKDISIDSIESDLKATTILDEDFSDIK